MGLQEDDSVAAIAATVAEAAAESILQAVYTGREEKASLQHHDVFKTEELRVAIVKGSVTEMYELDEDKMGEGSFGIVSKAVHKSTGAERAIKSILKQKVERVELEAEVGIMKHLDHPNIIRLYEVFEDFRDMHLVMELCTGGELFCRIVEEECFSERQAAAIMQQIASGIWYLHTKSVCHRDIKPENFLIQVPSKRWTPIENCVIKIIDFGAATFFQAGQVLDMRIGTPFYVAPQVLDGCYDQACDLWSCGVIMYILLCGYPPFGGSSQQEIVMRVKTGVYAFPDKDWEGISSDAKDLIGKLLTMDPQARYTAEQARGHTWIKNLAPKAKDVPLQGSQLTNMRAFRGQSKLKKAALQVIAQRLREDEIKQLKDMFKSLDQNGDGTVTFQELKEGIDKLQVAGKGENLVEIMTDMDVDGSGSIDYTEFLAATLDQKQYQEEQVCWSAFKVFDRDGNGTITRSELEKVLLNDALGKLGRTKSIACIMQDVDQDNDGQIDFGEFMQMMRVQED